MDEVLSGIDRVVDISFVGSTVPLSPSSRPCVTSDLYTLRDSDKFHSKIMFTLLLSMIITTLLSFGSPIHVFQILVYGPRIKTEKSVLHTVESVQRFRDSESRK